MIINQTALENLFRAFKSSFQKGFAGSPALWSKIATLVMSKTAAEDYGWLGDFPALRQWIGDRHIKDLKAHHYAITNNPFESTVGVKRSDIQDDVLGVYSPIFESMGQAAAEHPDSLSFALLAVGNATEWYDGQYFFDTDHPVGSSTVANYDATGGGALWCLLDTRRPLKPMIFQKRQDYEFQALVDKSNENVFMRNEYLYGVDARCNAGFGFWQMAYGSLNTLNATNVKAARTAMRGFKSDNGHPLNVNPNVIVCGPSNEDSAKELVNLQVLSTGASNPLYQAFEVIVSPYMT